ncbi:MAG: L-glutamate gamma-semialdehyde dehydrogenase [Phycisphaerales bacterium]|nr:L-glutamate gamma-semialdehyde dehydrogenase [Phycisphaerales bacterium]
MGSRIAAQAVEARTRKIGEEIFERIEGRQPSILNPQWWEERMMRVCTANEWLKVQAFRFIDVLPTLGDSRDVARHLREYFVHPSHGGGSSGGGPVSDRSSSHAGHHSSNPDSARQARREALRDLSGRGDDALIAWISRLMNFDRLDSLKARALSWIARTSSVAMAHRFIAGTSLEGAVRTIRRLRGQRMAFTVDVLGETALSEPEALHYQQVYLDLIQGLTRQAADWPTVEQIDLADGHQVVPVNVSVKLTSLFSQFDAIDPEGTKKAVKDRLRPLLRAGMAGGAHVHIDMEHYAIKDLTLDICREILMEPEFRDYPHFGIVLQAYLRDCPRDAAETVEWAKQRGTPVWVRLVKGAYWDSETVWSAQQHWPCPVWKQKWQSDACYEDVTRTLLEAHEHVHVAFGSHNIRSLAHAMALREALNVPGHHFEIQMLYGMGDPIKQAFVDMGQRCRIYTPYGQLLPGMAYLIRRLLENTANESFLRHSVDADTPKAALLENPKDIGRRTPPPRQAEIIKYEFEEPLMDPFINVPNTDYTREPNRQAMLAALAAWKPKLGREYPLVIGGERIRTGQWKDSVNPSRPKEIVGKIAQADAATAEKAVQTAAEAFKTWRHVAPAERAEYLFRVAEIMESRRFELSAIQSLETGKPWREADADVSEAIDFCNYYGKEMIRMAENARRRDIPGETNEYFYAPRGVVGVISPWNFPLAILTGMAVAAIVTGNTVIIKPAEPACVIAYGLLDVFEQAHLPPGVLNYVPGPGAVVGEIFVKHPKVAMIAFTGSREVGCRINKVAAEVTTSQPALKKVIAEMGGKNATIVDSDADMDEAIKGVLYSAFGYAGQKCSASSRAIVLDSMYDHFVERIVEAARSITVGPADDCGTGMPPVVDKKAYDSIRKYIEIGKTEARCVLDPDVRSLVEQTGGGYYIGPTIFADVAPDARIAREEIFGPVLAIIRARDIDEAIEIFNSTDFALTGGIFSRSPANIEKARAECDCGNFYINRKITGALVDLQPFGGFKMSGIGSKAGGPDYLIQFCEPRTVTENTLRRGFAPSDEVVEAVG